MNVYKYFSPKCTLFGFECLSALGEEIKSEGYKRALIVTDKNLIEMGMVGKVYKELDKYDITYATFSGVQPNPTVKNVDTGLGILKKEDCDFLISIGGGSAHDCAKAISILATNGGKVQDYIGIDKSTVESLPLVAINTTAGTASECTRSYVIVDEETGSKYGIRDKNSIASIAVNDHELMMNLPKGLTASTGMDALTHAIEAYVSLNGFCITSSLALSAMKLIFKHLEGATFESNEIDREGMATGQYLAGLAFGNAGVALVHAMSHQLSAVYDLPHGLSNAIILPEVMHFNYQDETVQGQYAEIANDIFPLECADLSTEESAKLLIDKVEALSDKIGTRVELSSLDVKMEDMDLLAEKTLQDAAFNNNPIIPTKDQVKQLFINLM